MPTIVTGEDISQPKDLQENTFGTATGQSDETVQNRVEEKFTPTHRTIATLSITNMPGSHGAKHVFNINI